MSMLREMFDYMKVRKKWWLAPIILAAGLVGGGIAVSQGSFVAPFIYTLF